MNFITDISNVHKDDIQIKLYRTWKHIQAKLSSGNKKYQANLTICKSWYYLSNFLEDISQLDDYDNFSKNPSKYKLLLKDNETHYSKNTVYFKEMLVRNNNAYPVSTEEYYKVYNNFQIKYCKYQYYISILDYKEIVNYGIGIAAISYKKEKGVLFITFANKVVQSRILDYIRDNKKHLGLKYLEDEVYHKDEAIQLKDTLICNKEYLNTSLLIGMLKEYINTLPVLEANILKLLLRGYNQKEISKILDIYPSKVSRIYNKMKVRIKGWV